VTDLDRRPARQSAAVSLVVAGLVVAVLWAASAAGAAVAAVGWACLLVGVTRSSRRLVSAWLVAAWLGAVLNAPAAPPLSTAGVVLGGVVAWDTGQRAVGLGRTLTREATTARVETVHAGATAAVGAVTLAVGYAAAVVVAGAGGLAGGAVLALAVAAAASLALLVGREG